VLSYLIFVSRVGLEKRTSALSMELYTNPGSFFFVLYTFFMIIIISIYLCSCGLVVCDYVGTNTKVNIRTDRLKKWL
jgi:amino acid permease